MRYYLTYNLPSSELAKDTEFRNKLLGSSHWFELKSISDGDNDTQITISVDERMASYMALKIPYKMELRPNHGI
jgi:hypothetical protein